MLPAFTPQFLSTILTFGIFILTKRSTDGALDISRAFTSLSLLVILSVPFSQLFQLGPLIIAGLGCLKRIEKFLNQPPLLDHRLLQGHETFDHAHAISDFNNSELQDPVELRKINLAQSETKNEINRDKYDFLVKGAAFAWPGQDPVLRNVNISIPKSAFTIVVGPTASGKTTLCKALLGEVPIRSGTVQLNSSPEIAVCHQQPLIFNSSLKENITAFSTPDVDRYNLVIDAVGLRDDINVLSDGNRTLLGSNGISLSGGQKQRVAIARAVYAQKRIAFFDDIFRGLDSSTERLVFDNLFGSTGLLRVQGTTAVLFTHDATFATRADHIILLEDMNILQGSYADLLPISPYLQESRVLADQIIYSKSEEDQTLPATDVRGFDEKSATPIDFDSSKGERILTLFKYYFSAVGARNTAILFFLATCLGFFNTFPSIWLTWWTNVESKEIPVNNGKYLGLFTLLQVLGLISTGAFFYHAVDRIVVTSGINLHHSALDAVMSAKLTFYTKTDAGFITNRFSQDMELIDSELPRALMNLIMNIFIAIGQLLLISVAAPLVAVTIPIILLVLSAIQRFYIQTSSRLRILDLETKSPLYTLFLETTSGIATIHPFGWHRPLLDRCYQRLNASQRPGYLLFMVQQWLSFVLGIISTILALLVVTLTLKTNTSSGFTGVGLVNLISLTSTLKSIILCWALSETSIGAVSRLRALEKLIKPEESDSEEKQTPPANWPSKGKIEIRNLSVSYDAEDGVSVLKNINMVIRPGEKIGICGRTGCGKSSFLLALLHMMELRSGSILIDDTNINDVPRDTLRLQLNTIPQEPFFLPGTIRLNLDPYESSTTNEIIAAVRETQLFPIIESLGGLSAEMKKDLLSHGQQQLFCLARALLHLEKRIILMDEATSSLDVEIDNVVQHLIRNKFREHTIVAVAHRATAIRDFDRVAILKDGELAEFDNPKVFVTERGLTV